MYLSRKARHSAYTWRTGRGQISVAILARVRSGTCSCESGLPRGERRSDEVVCLLCGSLHLRELCFSTWSHIKDPSCGPSHRDRSRHHFRYAWGRDPRAIHRHECHSGNDVEASGGRRHRGPLCRDVRSSFDSARQRHCWCQLCH